MEEYADDGLDYSGKCYISNSACYEDAKSSGRPCGGAFPETERESGEINTVGTTIGSHTGPGDGGAVLLGRKNEWINEETK
jgi:hypothetical protein